MPITSAPVTNPIVDQHPIAIPDNELIEEVNPEALDVVTYIPLRRLERVHRSAILDDYIVYL